MNQYNYYKLLHQLESHSNFSNYSSLYDAEIHIALDNNDSDYERFISYLKSDGYELFSAVDVFQSECSIWLKHI